MHYVRITLLTFFAAMAISASGQKGIIKQANKYFNAGKYGEALKLYDQVKTIVEDKDLLYRRAISNYHQKKADDAVRDFTLARRQGYDNKEIYLHTASALHSRGSYQDATKFYKNYLRYVDDQEEQLRVVGLIKQCKYAYNNQYNDQLAFVENLGNEVNTIYNETYPVQSPTTQSKYYFSSNRSGSDGGMRNSKGYKDEIYGQYSADMYAVELSNGNWTPISAFNPILNGPKNELIQGFSNDGSVLYFIKSQDLNSGQIYADTFSVDKDPEAFPSQLVSPIISELGDKDVHVFNSESMIFASRRAGGYGGYDLYITFMNGGQWTNPTNLGPAINSAYDEVSPFLSKSGTKLFFSSDRIDGFGGHDIFVSDYNPTVSNWNLATNLGAPINSPSNDLYYSVSNDGMTAILSSDRMNGIGGYDLYIAYYKEQVMEQLMYTETLPFIEYGSDSTSIAVEQDEVPTTIDQPVMVDKKVVKKEFFNEPLYYGADEIIVNASNRNKLNRIRDLLIVYPEISVVLTGHSIKEGLREFDLYFSIKRAEKAAKFLVDSGIDPARIKVKGLGSNYPHTIQNGSRIAEKNNRRIDVSFTKVPANRLQVVNETPAISETLKDGASDQYFKTLKGLAYKIEVAKTKQMYKGDVIRTYESGVVEKSFDQDQYTYTIGLFDSYQNAKRLKDSVIRQGIQGAKVVPYMNDEPLDNAAIEILIYN